MSNIDHILQVVEKNNWTLISGFKEIEKLCQSVMKENENLVETHISGKKNASKALEGKVWKKSEGRANMDMVKDWFKNNVPFGK